MDGYDAIVTTCMKLSRSLANTPADGAASRGEVECMYRGFWEVRTASAAYEAALEAAALAWVGRGRLLSMGRRMARLAERGGVVVGYARCWMVNDIPRLSRPMPLPASLDLLHRILGCLAPRRFAALDARSSASPPT